MRPKSLARASVASASANLPQGAGGGELQGSRAEGGLCGWGFPRGGVGKGPRQRRVGVAPVVRRAGLTGCAGARRVPYAPAPWPTPHKLWPPHTNSLPTARQVIAGAVGVGKGEGGEAGGVALPPPPSHPPAARRARPLPPSPPHTSPAPRAPAAAAGGKLGGAARARRLYVEHHILHQLARGHLGLEGRPPVGRGLARVVGGASVCAYVCEWGIRRRPKGHGGGRVGAARPDTFDAPSEVANAQGGAYGPFPPTHIHAPRARAAPRRGRSRPPSCPAGWSGL